MDSKLEALRKSPLFKEFSEESLREVAALAREISLPKGEFLFHEADSGEAFYVLVQGKVEILKKDEVRLAELGEGDVFGEMASMGSFKREASVRTTESSIFLELFFKKLPREIQNELSPKFSQVLVSRIKEGNVLAAEAVQKQLEHFQARSHLGNMLIYLLWLIFLYIYAIQALSIFEVQVISSTVITIPVLLFFGTFMFFLMKKSPFALREYGFTLKDWLKNLISSFFWTIPLLAFTYFAKWAMVKFVPQYAGLKVIDFSAALSQEEGGAGLLLIIVLIAAYLIFVPVQEIIYRGAMQTTLEKLLVTKRKKLVSIFVSNLPFSLIHLHLSFTLTIIVYFYGLVWGWMFARQRSLVGCIFSHLIVGLIAFFILSIQKVLPV